MASASITVTAALPATIESTTLQAVITKDPTHPGLMGFLVNAGSTTTWLAPNWAVGVAIPTNNAQVQGVIPLSAGASITWIPQWATIAHLSTGTTTLAWLPACGNQSID